ncbi:NAD-dependent succinate-semialdehyde dehydrogenase [Mycobacterium sp. ACS4331]|uniref:NAD-dependent succinate-semialdehyde dehydrogenase n=1 Tax=Mycobacterium sp. ACS4331 TaxID=1834121 RepID=UPI0007FCCE58|nr:NAD-dependent succinate-semialdehyde dehydrogenase [Mycobacterium sp. ACS4331]OBF29224.1 NAD-dependent succinate-semialdehyde dehydrogenase [Mycobacterium sp. ACS4331]
MSINAIITGLRATESLIIGGESRSATSTFAVDDPATAQTLTEVADGAAADATAAVDAASAAFASWAAATPRVRADILRRAYELMIADVDRLTALISAENGKTQADARGEVIYAAEFFRWFGEEAVRTDGGYGLSPSGLARTIVTHRPVGVAALITPWNFPAAMATRKIAPALAAGCTVVLKPASLTPLTAIAIVRLLEEAGVPAGVVNLVTSAKSAQIASTWLADDRVKKVSFTGSTGVGRTLLEQAAARIVNASMELGGNAPFVVTADADVDAAVEGAMVAKFRNSGQACTAANRFYVHTDIADEFVTRFGAAISALRVGPAADEASQIGPMISAGAAKTIRELVDTTVGAGAQIAASADVPPTGYYVSPTLLTGVPADAEILRTEIFGPVAPVVVWDDEDQLVEWVNGTEYGLAAYVYAGRLQDALRIAERTDAGMVGINRGIVSDPSAPFGGTNQSGLGREGARVGLHEFQETQYFSVGD